jgi:hypothetical protein
MAPTRPADAVALYPLPAPVRRDESAAPAYAICFRCDCQDGLALQVWLGAAAACSQGRLPTAGPRESDA